MRINIDEIANSYTSRPKIVSVITFIFISIFMTLLRLLFTPVGEQGALAITVYPEIISRLTYCALYLGLTLFFIRPGRRNIWEVILFIVLIIPITGILVVLDRPAIILILLPVTTRLFLDRKSNILLTIPLVILSYALFFFYDSLSGTNYYANASSAISFTVLTLAQGVFSYTAFELLISLEEKKQKIDSALNELHVYRQAELQRAALEERERLSRDVHDSLGHQLTITQLELQRLKRLLDIKPAETHLLKDSVSNLQGFTQEAFQQLREVVTALQPAHLNGELYQACQALADTFPGRVELRFESPEPKLDTDVKVALFRACQELITNAYKHAPGKEVSIKVAVHNGNLTMTSQNALPDEHAPMRVTHHSSQLGLKGLRDRLSGLGGTLEVTRTAQDHTVVLSVPIQFTEVLEEAL